MHSAADHAWSAIMRSSPSLLLLLTVLLSATPFILSISNMPTVFMSWMLIYYWALFRPSIIPFGVLFLLGLIQDIATGLPLGLSALVFVLLRIGVSAGRRFMTAHQFWVTWGGFAIVALLTAWFYWLVMVLLYDTGGAGFVSMTLSAVIAWIVYPIGHVVCNAVYTQLPSLQLRVHTL